ncbi:hypothetical protein P8452_57371 [Trifolium repens]|nr:hypothetical protein P8452_57371 [Trifolium repens]
MIHVPWMKKLLAITTFFTTCEVHRNDPKNERNMFCIDCIDNPYCGSCIKSHHKDHNVIQIRRSSYNELFSCKTSYISSSLCKTCDRNLGDSSCFCSLACKFAYIKKDGGFFVKAKEMEEMERLLEESIKASPQKEKAKSSRIQNLKRKVDKAGIDEENEDKREDNKEEDNKERALPVNRPSASLRKPNSRRKGIPHRAPFF